MEFLSIGKKCTCYNLAININCCQQLIILGDSAMQKAANENHCSLGISELKKTNPLWLSQHLLSICFCQ